MMRAPAAASRRSARRRQRGQMVPLAAVMALVILGGSALALDLTVNTHDRRSIQNVVDAAALAGAQDLLEPNLSSNSASMLQQGRQNAVMSVLKVLHTQLNFPVNNSNYASQAVQQGNCHNDGTVCDVDGAVFGSYAISVDTPPTTAGAYGNGAYNGDSHYVEVTLRQVTRNSLGGVVGSPSSIEGGHAVAYHFGSGQQFGFALYTNTVVTDGNDTEIVQGNVYAYRNINPSSQGHASFCAAQLSDGTQGNIVLGSPQWPDTADIPNPDPAGGALQQYVISPNGNDPDVVHATNDCSTVQGGQVAQTGSDETSSSGPHCPTAVQGVTLGSASYMDINSANPAQYTHACVAVPPVQEPSFSGPVTDTGPTTPSCPTVPGAGGNYTPGYWQCTGTNQATIHIDHPLAPGIYHIAHNPNCSNTCADVQVDQQSGNVGPGPNATGCPGGSFNVWLCDVTFWLDSNATISVGNGETAVITPYTPANGTGNDGRFPIYAPFGTSGQVVSINNTNTFVALSGTIYMPGGTFSVGQNSFVFIQGQAIVNVWAVQSGAHPNPDIRWDATRMAALSEILRIVE
jgi:hypothetical protein